jgi:RNA polymerase sigma-70 factor (ECF subfamily)
MAPLFGRDDNGHARGVGKERTSVDPLRALGDAAGAGDRQALSRLLRALSPQILRVARGVLGASHPDVEDAAQESLVEIAAALSTFRGECTLTHFACRIAARRCVTVRKRARQRGERREIIASQQRTTAPDPVEPSGLRRDAVRGLLDTLPDEQSETMVLRFVLGFSLAEVADATGVPVNTVRSRVRLSKEALRRRIESDPSLAAALLVEA